MSFNIIKNWENRSILYDISLDELVRFIADPPESHKETVKLARLIGNQNPLYRKIKSELPCVIPNFYFGSGYVKGSNVLNSTGYLYIDVDKNLDINLDSKYIAAYWKSLSGLGYSILISVAGVTKSNFKDATVAISEDLGLPLDKCILTIDRNCVIPYDSDAFLNTSPTTYTYVHEEKVYRTVLTKQTHTKGTTVVNSLVKDSIVTSTKNTLIESRNFEGEVMVDLGQKVGYATIGNTSIKIPNGKRNSSLFFMGCQLKVLNTWLDFSRFCKYMAVVNRDGCETPVDKKELNIICNNVFKKFEEGILKVINNKSCRFLFNPDYQLTPKEKRSYMMEYINKKRSEKVKELIEEYIKETGCTNNSKIARDCQVSRTTVLKYKKQLGL